MGDVYVEHRMVFIGGCEPSYTMELWVILIESRVVFIWFGLSYI